MNIFTQIEKEAPFFRSWEEALILNVLYMLAYVLDAFIQSDSHTQYCGQSPQEHFGVKCLRDTTTCWLQWGLNLCSPDPNTNALTHCATRPTYLTKEKPHPKDQSRAFLKLQIGNRFEYMTFFCRINCFHLFLPLIYWTLFLPSSHSCTSWRTLSNFMMSCSWWVKVFTPTLEWVI